MSSLFYLIAPLRKQEEQARLEEQKKQGAPTEEGAEEADFAVDISAYYDRMRLILDFYASAEQDQGLVSTFVGNAKANVLKILRDDSI